MRPWAIPDKWIDNHDDPNDFTWTADDTFETVDAQGNPLPDADMYRAPSTDGATGFSVHDVGVFVILKIGDPQAAMKPGWFYPVDIGNAGAGADAYRTAIATCQANQVRLGDVLNPLHGSLQGPTVQGVADLINLDPTAAWDPNTKQVIDSCAPACAPVSPRIVPIAAFDPAQYEATQSSGQPAIVITNVVPVFVDGVAGGTVTGYITAPLILQP